MATLSGDAFLTPPPPPTPRCLLSQFGHPWPHPSAQMESPGHVASGLFSKTLMCWLCCAFPQTNVLQEEEDSCEDFSQLLRSFEHWLQVDNSKLVRIIAMRTATAKDLRTRETKLQVCSQGKALFPKDLPPEMCLSPGSSKNRSTYIALELFWLVYK